MWGLLMLLAELLFWRHVDRSMTEPLQTLGLSESMVRLPLGRSSS
jgi:hypothetical protein